jgi:alpha-1,2-mannosyltransferase
LLIRLDKVKAADKVKLMLIGSCRNKDDEQRVEDLKWLCKELCIESFVEFKLNLSFDDLKQSLADSTVGLHSMKEEHFGIGVVECMAAGTMILAHNSGGPKEDIIVPYKGERTGYLAESEEEYSENMMLLFNLNSKQKDKIRVAAREHVKKFSQFNFNESFLYAFKKDCLDKFNFFKEKSD